MEGEIHRLNSHDFEEDLKQSKTKSRRNRDDKSRRRSCRRSRVIDDTHYDLILTQHHRDSTISALTMEDIMTFQGMYDKCREIESSNNMMSTPPSRRHRPPPPSPPSSSTVPTATAAHATTTTATIPAPGISDSENERLNSRKSFYDLFLSRERESAISEITFEDWKSLNELYGSFVNSNINDQSIDSFDSFQCG
jgi:hypothetical protein